MLRIETDTISHLKECDEMEAYNDAVEHLKEAAQDIRLKVADDFG